MNRTAPGSRRIVSHERHRRAAGVQYPGQADRHRRDPSAGRLGFRGYVHLKLMPGVEEDQIERAMLLADRVSINLEAPNAGRLGRLAPHKIIDRELLAPLHGRGDSDREAHGGQRRSLERHPVRRRRCGRNRRGAPGDDRRLYRKAGRQRAYFSAFELLRDTPLENHPPEIPLREHRLYQASSLLRDYGFGLDSRRSTRPAAFRSTGSENRLG